MANLNTLFDFSKFEKRKPANQQDFETENKDLLLAFVSAVHANFEKMHRKILKVIPPIDQDKNLCAIVMSGYMCGFFKRNYPHHCYKATPQRFKLYISGRNIYVKKLDETAKLPSNIPTDESLKILYNLTDTQKDTESNIFLGWTIPDDKSQISGVYAVCAEGEEILWISDLTDLSEQNQAPIVPISPNPIVPKVKPGVKRKKAQNE